MSKDSILVINAGSSSLKFALFDADDLSLSHRGQVSQHLGCQSAVIHDADGKLVQENQHPSPDPHHLNHAAALAEVLDWLEAEQHPLRAIGHRVVHGGLDFTHPELVGADTLEKLRQLEPLAPLHQPHNVNAIAACAEQLPGLPQIACFDTAFHADAPAVARRFALPQRYHQQGIQRYGFHGLSYEYIHHHLSEIEPQLAKGRVVVAHLGNGASLCAIDNGRSIDTTMGFTALDGLPMATRTGNLDAGVLLYLLQNEQLSAEQLSDLLYKHSGLLGVSGISGDMRALTESQEPAAREAVELFIYQCSKQIAAMSAALQGIDALVFTGGIGEHQAHTRAAICRHNQWLGLQLDDDANQQNQTHCHRADSPVKILVLPTNEEWMIAAHAKEVLGEMDLELVG